VYIPRDYHSQQPKGFAFVEYANIDMAREAREEMDRFRIKGSALEVVYAQERRKTPNEMRGRAGHQINSGDGDGRDFGREFERSSSFQRHKHRRAEEGGHRDRDKRPRSSRADEANFVGR
jgi:FUS-interacting serine-arginine-rich protein 1